MRLTREQNCLEKKKAHVGQSISVVTLMEEKEGSNLPCASESGSGRSFDRCEL